ncbi:hypothetical protein MMC26_005192 [Xylographa opegraphella]|nr:hypothetical protein [Xylographa opegraphella]
MSEPLDRGMAEDEEAYVSSEDEDFDPSAVHADENVSSSSEDEAADIPTFPKPDYKRPTKHKRRKKGEEAEDLGFENSGDEATIKKGSKRKRKGELGDDDSGGEGGFVKTRSMRAIVEQEKKKPLAHAEGATIDVEALWKSMNLGETLPFIVPPESDIPIPKSPATIAAVMPGGTDEAATRPGGEISVAENQHKDLITIPYPRMVGGTLTQVFKTVPRTSEEAIVYLQRYSNAAPVPRSVPHRRVSKWDPNPNGTIRGLPSDVVQTGEKLILLDVHQGERLKSINKSHLSDWPAPVDVPTTREYNWRKPQVVSGTVKKWKVVVPKEQKMNVVNKSKLDWEAHVEQEGDREELVQAAKAKGAYLDRVDFLGRTEINREEELRIARMK